MPEIQSPNLCPNCGRSYEPGFRFCDNCGQKLDEPPAKTGSDEPTWHVPIEDTSKRPPLLERMRDRRGSRSEADDELFAPPREAQPDEPKTGPIDLPPVVAPRPAEV